MVVPADEAETVAATLLELVPAGHELNERGETVELAVYVEQSELARLRRALPELAGQPVDAGWEDAWRRFHRPVVVGSLWVGPPWEEPPAGLQAIVIDPGRAFGTGAHPTTQLCLALLQEVQPGPLVDAGCGSGVLAIAAARLGFAPILALDADAEAVDVARENAALNGATIDARVADVVAAGELPEADVVVANIDLAAGERVAAAARARRLITAGYLEGDAPRFPGWRRLERRLQAGWAADLLEPQ